jgi:hypothetical protein
MFIALYSELRAETMWQYGGLQNVMYSELPYENPENGMFSSSEWECHYVNIWKSQGNNSPSPKWQAHNK